jgi:hypothetical protein|tara:strand:+ start:969 stop:1244 length:276 start_codon:yes stop_codon:yes gene_type:complete
MNKYASITVGGGVEQFSVKDVASCYLDSSDDIVIDYIDGSQSKIASGSALVQADVDIVFDGIKSAQQEKWTQVLYVIPALSQTVNAFTFTF